MTEISSYLTEKKKKKKPCSLLQGSLPFISVKTKTKYFMGTKRSLGILRSAPGGKFHKNALLGFVVVVVGWFALASESSKIFFFFKKKKKMFPKRGGGGRTKISATLKTDQG